MTELATRPEVPLQVITSSDVRASIRRAKKSLEDAAKEIVWQIEMEAWRTLGYTSWGALREAEYGGAAFMVPSKSRPEIVARIRDKGLTQQEIADTAGVSQTQVSDDLKALNTDSGNETPTITNVRGQQRPAFYTRPADDDVIDAEIVEEFCARCGADQNGCTCSQVQQRETDPAPAEPVDAIACPTCHGTGKVTP